MQTHVLHSLTAITALAICYRERRKFSVVFDEITRREGDRGLFDRIIWGTPPKNERDVKQRDRGEPAGTALVDRLMTEAERRAEDRDQQRRVAGAALSRMACATLTTNEDCDLL